MQNFMKTIINGVQKWTKKEIDTKVSNSKADWNENDTSSDNYIRNRTHWDDFALLWEGSVTVDETEYSGYTFDSSEYLELDDSASYCIEVDGERYFADSYTKSNQKIVVNFRITHLSCNIEIYNDAIYFLWCELGDYDVKFYRNFGEKLNIRYLPKEVAIADDVQNVMNVATNAQSTANIAKTNAATAQSTADIAKTNAATAQRTADDAANNAMSKYNPTGTGYFNMGHSVNSTIGTNSFAMGNSVRSTGSYSFAIGEGTCAVGKNSFAGGSNTLAEGTGSHAEGWSTEATGDYSHSEGLVTEATNGASHAEGSYTIASYANQHVQGRYNVEGLYAHIVGNGTSKTTRSNAHTLDWNGVGWYQGGLQVGGAAQDDEGVGYVPAVPAGVQVGQAIVVKAVDENGKPTEWEAVDLPTDDYINALIDAKLAAIPVAEEASF